MADDNHTAVLGAGVIGASWTALFLASGRSVAIFDPADNAEKSVRDYVENAWPTLTELGLTTQGKPGAITFHTSAGQAIERAAFVQENVPERIVVKHDLYAKIRTPDRLSATHRELPPACRERRRHEFRYWRSTHGRSEDRCGAGARDDGAP